MSQMENDPELCGVCQSNREAHAALNHEFNREGRLVPKIKSKPTHRGGANIELMVAYNRLIVLMQAKGLLDNEDLIFLATGVHHGGLVTSGPGAGGDMGTGSEETPH